MKAWQKSLLKQIYRYTHRRNMRHMERVWPYLKIKEDPSGARHAYWRGRLLFTSPPLSHMQEWSTNLEKALIIATGPSIKEQDFSGFENIFIVGVNGAVALQDTQNIHFDAHVVVDPGFVKQRFNLFRRMIEQKVPCFMTYHCVRQACELDPSLMNGANIQLVEFLNKRFNEPKLSLEKFYVWAREQEGLVTCPQHTPVNDKVGFSLDPNVGLFDGATVAYWALQLLCYARFKMIGIAGMDLGNSRDTPRFYESDGDQVPSTLLQHYHSTIEPSFRLASSVLNSRGQEVFNLSPVSLMPESALPKMTLSEFMEYRQDESSCLVSP